MTDCECIIREVKEQVIIREGARAYIGQGAYIETHTLVADDITNKYITLNRVPKIAAQVVLLIQGAPAQFYGADYAMDGVETTRLTWDGLTLDGELSEGDNLTVIYN